MLTRSLPVSTLILFVILFSATLPGQQQKPAASVVPGTQEFPVVMQQNVAAGKTPVGAKIKAKLEVATLIDGKVIPRSAVFSGEVIDSAAKTATDPSRLAIRIDSVVWKKGSAALTAYLTAWYYPLKDAAGQDLQYGPTQPANRTWNGQGQYPDPNSKVYKPFPGSNSNDKSASAPDTPSATISNHRVLMKDVATESRNDGEIALISKHSNIKLDKLTTYVLASRDLFPAK